MAPLISATGISHNRTGRKVLKEGIFGPVFSYAIRRAGVNVAVFEIPEATISAKIKIFADMVL